MSPVDQGTVREVLDALIAASAMLGGSIAYSSGSAASRARALGEPPEALSPHVNEGVADGFEVGALLALVALIIVLWS